MPSSQLDRSHDLVQSWYWTLKQYRTRQDVQLGLGDLPPTAETINLNRVGAPVRRWNAVANLLMSVASRYSTYCRTY